MLLLFLFAGVVGFALILWYFGPKMTEGRRYPDERMRQRIISDDFSAMKPRTYDGVDRSHKKRWDDFMDDEGDY